MVMYSIPSGAREAGVNQEVMTIGVMTAERVETGSFSPDVSRVIKTNPRQSMREWRLMTLGKWADIKADNLPPSYNII